MDILQDIIEQDFFDGEWDEDWAFYFERRGGYDPDNENCIEEITRYRSY